ncbi:3-oxoacyl-ACP reductase FabG [Arthrobacter sp. KBS0702]|uniref:3-oxoacyl-ACP reductase FabG n=1 Tax=Arthrobacter sp. KBS0702 TaxID=2578107 RepID=UPI00110EA027|nr:3-oxoacyl-ACP reductase FabG [Arthrobacter sp. KBS0702]QDW29623.1 3-oxoacyl-ACP reductase FabG [Arthrobacter sp. KBS0702]
MLLQNKTSVVTGGARGIGLATAQELAAHGSNIVLADLDAAALGRAAETLQTNVVKVVCDVTSPGDVDALVAAAVDSFGSLDVMVNNAGFTRDATMRKMTESDFDDVVSVHLKGAWLGTRAAADVMRRLGTAGSIINVSSISGKVGMPGQTNYSAAKAGIVGLTKAAAKELGFAGIRVNAIQPGIIRTDMVESLRPEILDQKLSEIPLARFGEPGEVASVVLFLASGMSSYMTGTVLEITGGRHA